MSGSGTGTPVVASAETTLGDMIEQVQTRLGDPSGTIYSDEMTRLMLNSGVQYLFPKFYAIGSTALSGNGITKVFALEPTIGSEIAAVIDAYELETTYSWSEITDSPLAYIGDSSRLAPLRDYRVARGALGEAFLNFFSAPNTDVVVSIAERPSTFSGDDDTLADIGFPERARDCLVFYACWQLLSQRLPENFDTLVETQRQVETNDLTETQTQGGTETQTQTDNKTQQETGTKDSTTTESKTGTTGEVIDLEQTENKDETLTTTGGETTTDVRTAATTTNGETGLHKSTNDYQHVLETESTQRIPALTTAESGTESTTHDAGTLEKEVNPHTQKEETQIIGAKTTDTDYDEGTPPRATEARESTQTVTTTSVYLNDKKDWEWNRQTRDGEDETTFGKHTVETGTDTTTHTKEDTTSQAGGEEDVTVENKTESTSEDSQGTVTKDETQATAGNNLTVSSQEKTTTDDTTDTIVLDEDTTTTVTNTGTSSTELERDTTQETLTTGGKTTSLSTMATFRDRVQTAQYYKLLFDMEVQTKRMRPWTSRGL
jgi:hypothetical protein